MPLLQLDQPSWLLLKIRKVLIFIPLIFIKILLIILLSYTVFILYASLQKSLQTKKLLWLVFGIGMCSFVWYFQNHWLRKRIAFVVKESAFVYAGPEQSFHTIFQLKSGTSVQLLHQKASMSHIQINGQQGWIRSDDIALP